MEKTGLMTWREPSEAGVLGTPTDAEKNARGERPAPLGALALVVLAAGCIFLLAACPSISLTRRSMEGAEPERLACFDEGESVEEAARDGEALFEAARQQTPLADLSGTWAQRVVTTSLSTVPFVGDVVSTNVSLLWLEVAQQGNALDIQARTCSVEIESSTGMMDTIVPDSFIDNIGISHRRAVVQPGPGGGLRFYQLRLAQLIGVELDDPMNGTLPESADDPRVIDQDGDGEPGMTVRVEGIISGDIYVAQRNWKVFCGDLVFGDETTGSESAPRIAGNIRWGMDQRVLGASNGLLNRQTDSVPHPDLSRNTFEIVPIDPEWGCDDIEAHADGLFPPPPPSPSP